MISFLTKFGLRLVSPSPDKLVSVAFHVAKADVNRAIALLDKVGDSPSLFGSRPPFEQLLGRIRKLSEGSGLSLSSLVVLYHRVFLKFNLRDEFRDRFFEIFEFDKLPIDKQRDVYSAVRLLVERPQFVGLKAGDFNAGSLLASVRARLQEKILHEAKSFGSLNRNRSEKNSVLFIFGHAQPLPQIGSHFRQVACYVGGFAKEYPDKKVCLLITNESTTRDFKSNLHALPKNWRSMLDEQFKSVLGWEDFPENLELVFFNPFDSSAYCEEIYSTILNFKPSVAISWLGFFSADLFHPLLSAICPLMGVQFQAGNPVSDDFDLVLAHGDIRNQNFKTNDNVGYINHPIPMLPERKSLARESSDVKSQDQFMLVTTLGNSRIERAFLNYSDDFVVSLVALFDAYPNMAWTFIGVKESVSIVKRHPVLMNLVSEGRIKIFAHIVDLRSFYEHCDLYVHLPSLGGGGWSIALAAVEGVPILAESGKDADNFLPSECLYNDAATFFSGLKEMLECPSKRELLVSLQLEAINSHSIESTAHFVNDTIDLHFT